MTPRGIPVGPALQAPRHELSRYFAQNPGGLPDPHTIVGADPSKDTALDEQRSILHSSLASTNVIPRLRRVLRGSGGPAESLHPGNVEMEPEVLAGYKPSPAGTSQATDPMIGRASSSIPRAAEMLA